MTKVIYYKHWTCPDCGDMIPDGTYVPPVCEHCGSGDRREPYSVGFTKVKKWWEFWRWEAIDVAEPFSAYKITSVRKI